MTIGRIDINEKDLPKICGAIIQLEERADTAGAASGASLNSLGYGVGMTNGTFVASASAGALTIALKTLAGSDPSAADPVTVFFRNVTGTAGDYVVRQVTAATSFVISSGSTMGVTSSTAFRLWIVGFDDASTFRLGAINCSTTTQIFPLAEGLASSTAEGGAGAADSAGVIYTGTAVTTKAMRILGYAEWSASGLTAGTWTTTNLIQVQLFGPGIKKPADAVQTISLTQNANDSTASGSYVVTSTTLAILLTSAVNLIAAKAGGPGDTNAAGRVISVRLSRGTTANTDMIGFTSAGTSAANSIVVPLILFALDRPNVSGSQTYAVQFRDDSATGVNWGAHGNNVSIELTELMG